MDDFKFDWDDENRNHLADHHITPEEAEEVLTGPTSEEAQEPVHGEERTLAYGVTARGRFLAVAYTERATKIRPITGWDMNKRELRNYVKAINGD